MGVRYPLILRREEEEEMATSMKKEKKQLSVKVAKTVPSDEVPPAPMMVSSMPTFGEMMLLVDEMDAAENASKHVIASGVGEDGACWQNTGVKRTKKQPASSKVVKTSPPAETSTLTSMTNPQHFSDLMLFVENDNAVDNWSSTEDIFGNRDADDERKMSYILGEKQDRVVGVTPNEITITSALYPYMKMSFDANRRAHFIAVLSTVDECAKELNRETRPVACREHLGDGYYVSVTSGYACVDFREFYLPYGLTTDQVRPTKSGIALRLSEWKEFLKTIPAIHAEFPEFANAKRCVDDDSHLGQLGWQNCTSCFPFGV